MKNRFLGSIACSILVLLSNLPANAQVNAGIDLNQYVTIRADQRPLGEIFRDLSRSYGVVVGLELSRLDSDHDDFSFATNFPAGLEDKVETKGEARVTLQVEPVFKAKKYLITIRAEQVSLREALDTIVKQMRNYRWELNDGVVNIIPIQGRDKRLEEFFALDIKDFSLGKSRPPVMMVRYKIMARPEVTAFLDKNRLTLASIQSGFTKALHREFQGDLEYSNLTVRRLLNRVALANGGGWIVQTMLSTNGDVEFLSVRL